MTDAADYNCPVCEAWIGRDGMVESANARSFQVDDRTLVKCGGVSATRSSIGTPRAGAGALTCRMSCGTTLNLTASAPRRGRAVDTGPGSDYAWTVRAGRREQAMKDVTVTLDNRPQARRPRRGDRGSGRQHRGGLRHHRGRPGRHPHPGGEPGRHARLAERGGDRGERRARRARRGRRGPARHDGRGRTPDRGGRVNIELISTTFGAVRLVLGVDDLVCVPARRARDRRD
jgi:hypothetical protein